MSEAIKGHNVIPLILHNEFLLYALNFLLVNMVNSAYNDRHMRTLIADSVNKIGEEVTLQGWVHARRDHGKIMFLDLRDRTGIVQMVGVKSEAKNEDVVEVNGFVKKRPETMINDKIPTGSVEVEIKKLTVLSKAHELPLPIDTDGYDINEEIRLKYRYLDLRRPRMQRNIKMRSKFVDLVRQFLFSEGFTEIETPMLTKSTPEGSRDFLVPSRIQPGKFYALPQSPQQYKQLLMAAGFERYFQIARCIRDEDPRADRGFEHTQIDIEMSFVDRADVMAMDEKLITTVVETMGFTIKQKPFPVYTCAESMKQFHADKFDLRTEEDKKNGILAFAWVVDFPFFEKDKTGAWTFTHNPFSAPKPEHKAWLLQKEHVGDILTSQYDLVCNGYEVGGGSIRSHEPEVLSSVFSVMGYSEAQIKEQFGHMLTAFGYGVPPHGGLAHGVERLLMTILNEPYLREVVAFPMTSSGQTSVMDAPSVVSQGQLIDLGISVTKKQKISDVYGAITKLFDTMGFTYKKIEHAPAFTSEESAKIRGTSIHQGAKALIMIADKNPFMIVLPADLKVDTKLVKQTLSIKDLRMATPDEVVHLTGTQVGAVPPLGMLFDLPLYVDVRLRENDEIAFNAGEHTKSILMKEADFEKVAKSIIGEFSKITNG